VLSHGGGAVAVGDGVRIGHHVRGGGSYSEDVTLGEGGEVAEVLELPACRKNKLEILALCSQQTCFGLPRTPGLEF